MSAPPGTNQTKFAVRLRRRLMNLRTLLTLTLFSMMGVTGFLAVHLLNKSLFDNKKSDVWAILFLELENQASDIARRVKPALQADLIFSGKTGDDASLATLEQLQASFEFYQVDFSGKMRPSAQKRFGFSNLADFATKGVEKLAPWNLIRSRNRLWLLGHPGLSNTVKTGKSTSAETIAVAPFLGAINLKSAKVDATKSVVYIVNKQGQLLYTNLTSITETKVKERPLVQKFISLPIWQGQIEFKNDAGVPFYGYFTEVPDTNLVVFAETPKLAALGAVRRETSKLSQVLAGVLLVALILLQIPLVILLRPIGKLVTAANAIGSGQFAVEVPVGGQGELKTLAEAFRNMVLSLRSRDESIARLMREQQAKIRIEQEIAIARSIQDDLLPSSKLQAESGLEVAAAYIPATEVAGDWYNYHYDPVTDTSIIAIVDISGHGAGSSMFTAICAAVFEELIFEFHKHSDPLVFFNSFSRQILKHGKGKWAATAQVLVYRRSEREFTFYNAGHTPPVFHSAGGVSFASAKFSKKSRETESEQETKGDGPIRTKAFTAGRSAILGMASGQSIAIKKIPFSPGDMVILYTDGLTERKAANGRAYGVRRLVQLIDHHGSTAPSALVEDIHRHWQTYGKGLKADDDLCILAVRCSS